MKKPVNILLGIAVLAAISLAVHNYLKLPDIGYVDTIQLYKAYKMKTDMDGRAKERLGALKAYADSLETMYGLIPAPEREGANAIRLTSELKRVAEIFGSEQERLDTEIATQAWKRLNDEIASYAKDNGLDMLVGANGTGTVLYGNASMDHTQKVIDYANKRYDDSK